MSEFVDSLEFTSVKLDAKLSGSYKDIKIYFILNEDFAYYIEGEKPSASNKNWHEIEIYHYSRKICSYCKYDSSFSYISKPCFVLLKYKKEILERLLNHPKVRLRQLFL